MRHRITTIFGILMATIHAARIDPSTASLSLKHVASIASFKQICQRHSDDLHDKVRALAMVLQLDWYINLRRIDEPFFALINNWVEQALRHWVMSHCISHGTRSSDGSLAMALLPSVLEVCRLRIASYWRFLTSVIDAARKNCALPSLRMSQRRATGV